MPATITYIGNVEFQPASDPVWSGSDFELDTCRIPFQGAATKKAAFLASLRKFSALTGFNKMFYVDYSDDGAKVFPTVDLIYTGFRTGSAPEPKAEDGRAIQQAQAQISPTSGTYSGQTISLAVSYFASRTSWSWYQATDPLQTGLPDFVKCREKANPLKNILIWRVTGNDGTPGSLGLAEATQLFNQLTVAEVLTDLRSSDIIPKALWKCEASVDYAINNV